MKFLEQAQAEALAYLEQRLSYWKFISKTGDIPTTPASHGRRITFSRKDKAWLDKQCAGRGDEAKLTAIKALADRKVKAAERDIANLKRKLGRD